MSAPNFNSFVDLKKKRITIRITSLLISCEPIMRNVVFSLRKYATDVPYLFGENIWSAEIILIYHRSLYRDAL